MKVLLSIKPEYVNLIFSAKKRFEYRRKIFSRDDIDVILVYASAPVMRIVGEFKVRQIIKASPPVLWETTHLQGGVSRDFFFEYFKGRQQGYAIEVASFKLYDKPKELSELGISTAPQSFRYVE